MNGKRGEGSWRRRDEREFKTAGSFELIISRKMSYSFHFIRLDYK